MVAEGFHVNDRQTFASTYPKETPGSLIGTDLLQ